MGLSETARYGGSVEVTVTLSNAFPGESGEDPFDSDMYAELVYEAEKVLAELRARPICEVMARVAGRGDIMHPAPCYATIIHSDFEAIPEAEIMVRVGCFGDVRILSLPNWPGLDDSLERYVLAAGGPQLLLVRWYDEPIEGHDGLLVGICPGIFDPEPYIDVVTCSDSFDLSDRWPTRLRVIAQAPQQH